MAYQSYYNVTDWQNLPSQKTSLSRKNLLHAENGIKEADNRIVQLDAKKAELSIVNAMVKDINLDTKTGILTVTLLNGTTKTFDLDIERVVTNFDITDDNELVLTLADGTQKKIDLTRFVYSVVSTDTVAMEIKDRAIRAVVVDGSITMKKLDAAIQVEFRQNMLEAQSARDSSLQYSKFAKRYAIGDPDFEGSDKDNAKYYYERAKDNNEASAVNAQTATDKANTAADQAIIATQRASAAALSANSASADSASAKISADNAKQSETIAVDKAAVAINKAALAEQKAEDAVSNASLAKRYAVGGVVPEDVNDNAGWFYQQAKHFVEIAQEIINIAYPTCNIDPLDGHLYADEGKGVVLSINDAGHLVSTGSASI